MISIWQQIYDSAWHQPRALLAFAAVALGLVLRRAPPRGCLPFFSAWSFVCAIEIMLDAWLTGTDSPLSPDYESLKGNLAIAFVIFGDARFYVLIERYTRDPAPTGEAPGTSRRALAWGTLWGLLASLVLAPLARTVPALRDNVRMIYLTYECVALAQALVWLRVVIPRRMARVGASPATARWLREAALFLVAQYTLWALSDVLILWVHPAAYLLRVLPNLMYYGLFVGFVTLRAPPEIGDPRSSSPAAA